MQTRYKKESEINSIKTFSMRKENAPWYLITIHFLKQKIKIKKKKGQKGFLKTWYYPLCSLAIYIFFIWYDSLEHSATLVSTKNMISQCHLFQIHLKHEMKCLPLIKSLLIKPLVNLNHNKLTQKSSTLCTNNWHQAENLYSQVNIKNNL